ncbi:MAG: ferrous iron transport protein B [Candidatus Methanomethylophilaceae archaeon]|jgi:ferrous iron transport protein B
MTIRIALAGNPNCGKTTMFNRLTGSSQRVGNWPGVTIDRKEGRLKGHDAIVIDLPGIYSLSPYSPEEIVSRNFLINDRPDVIVDIVDATNLERNLYLTMQILDIGIPVVIAMNMIDTVRKEGISIDTDILSKSLGCKVIETSALKGEGLDELIKAAVRAKDSHSDRPMIRFSDRLESYVSSVSKAVEGIVPEQNIRWNAIKLLEKDQTIVTELDKHVWTEKVEPIIRSLEKEFDDDSECIIAEERYSQIERIVSVSVKKSKDPGKLSASDKVDRIVTNRWLGLPIFAGIMFFVYYISISTVGAWGTDWVNDTLFGEYIIPGVRTWLENANVNPALIGLVVDGIIGGVGAVLGFLPQIIILFILLVILEDCGYMARIAFVMDRIFRRFGLSGKSFIPVLIGTGCGVPGIMASRTIESTRDRRITAMTTTFIPCSAKLPIIALIAGALFMGSAWVALSAYFLGILCILMSGIILKKWRSLSGEPSPFIMELPPYHIPGIITVIKSTLDRGWAFVKKAGTFILLACSLVWFLSTFSWNLAMVESINSSMLADIGNSICWIFKPLGWGNWQFSVATITGLLAKENVVGTFGVLFNFAEVSEDGNEIWTVIASMLTPIAGFSFLAFNLICAPCFAAIGAMKRELGDWRSTGFAVLYQCVFAYVIAMIIYQFGSLLIYGTFGIGTVVAAILLMGLIYLLVSKDPFRTRTANEGETSC